MRVVTQYRQQFLEIVLRRPLTAPELDALEAERCLGCGAPRRDFVTKPHAACGWRSDPPARTLPPLTLPYP